MILTETIAQAKPGSRDARPESLLYRLRANRGIKALTVVAILSATLWLVGCNTEQGEKPKNPDTDTANADNSSEQLNQQERSAGAKLQFKAETAEQAEQVGHRAIYSMLKGSLEQLLRDNDTVFKSGEEAEEFVGTELGAFFDEVISNRKEGF